MALAALVPTIVLQATLALASPQAEVVGQFNETLLSLLDGDSDFDGRFAKIEPALKEAFDLEFMSSKVLGRGWKDLTPEQKVQWLETFTRLTASNYAGRFVGEKGPTFETLAVEEGARNTTMVRTKLVDPAKEDVELTYRLRETPDGWKVIDCYLNGTDSEVALRKSEFGSVLRRDGFDSLVTAVNSKSEALASGTVP